MVTGDEDDYDDNGDGTMGDEVDDDGNDDDDGDDDNDGDGDGDGNDNDNGYGNGNCAMGDDDYNGDRR